MDIELLSIDPKQNWPAHKQHLYRHLEALTMRIIESKTDITGNLGADWTNIALVYGMFAMEAQQWYHQVCQLAKDYDFDRCQDKLTWAANDNKLKTLKRLTDILKFYSIDTSFKDEKYNDADAISAMLPKGVDPNFALEHGFYPLQDGPRTGYYFRERGDAFKAQSNFIMEPLMHVYSKQDNKRIIAIHNGQKRAVLDMPSRAMISVEQFGALVYEEGNYMFWGSKLHLMKILNTINNSFPVCYELKTLGWQPEGFFAWSNAIHAHGRVLPFDELGIATFGDHHYFSPSASDIYASQRQEDDEYENDRYLLHKPARIAFGEWCALMQKVYPDHAMYGIGFVFIGLFKDVIYKIDNNCPHLSAYGEKGSGKSKFAESISAVFLTDLQPFNLNHGTEFAFFNRLSRFRNCVTWLDEFDDQAIKEDRFQSIKGAYDGAGRERGKGTNKNRTEIARVNSALLLTGQYLSTRDDNAALTRCIILSFTPNDSRGPDAISAYDKLKQLEKTGLSGLLVELLQHRTEFEKEYPRTFAETFADLRQAVTDAGGQYKERVLRNYCAMVNSYKFFTQYIQFPFTLAQVKAQAVRDVIRLSTLIAESDSLADFWNTVVYLLETGEIYDGYHFRILHTAQINVRRDGKDVPAKFPTATKLLAIRLTTIHKLYLEAHRKQTGKTGINMQSLELYISTSKGYVGKNSSLQFTERETGKITSTSSYIFEYDKLGVPLEQQAPENPGDQVTIEGVLDGDIHHEMLAGKPMLRFKIVSISTHVHDSRPFRNVEMTTIYHSILSDEPVILSRQRLVVTGHLKQTFWTDSEGTKRPKRSMDAVLIKLADAQMVADYGENDVPFP